MKSAKENAAVIVAVVGEHQMKQQYYWDRVPIS